MYMTRKRGVDFSENMNMEVVKYVAEKEKLKKEKEEAMFLKNELKIKWETNKETISVMENKVSLIKDKLEFVKGLLKEYYLSLLKQGTDIRYIFFYK